MRTILILLDSLNRNMLRIYNKDSRVITPNIDNLADKSAIFDNQWVGSAPCMPARRDIFTGRLNFLERNWGPIEPFDINFTPLLKKHGIYTHMVTDHYHYFCSGGENYCQQFDTWDFERGQESDPWVSQVDPPKLPENYYGKVKGQYELNRMRFKHEEDYSTPRVFMKASQWLEENKDSNNFFLMVEAFDPHEPFDCPQEYLDIYNDSYQGPRFDWPSYGPITEPSEAVEHLRKRYAGTLTMADKWLGKIIEVMNRYNMWEDTLLILTTDHGLLLGEHGFMGKNVMHMYNELSHLPMIIHLPGNKRAGERINAITQNIDLMPTILEYYNIDIPEKIHGHSLWGILNGMGEKIRDTAIYGCHGMAVNITDGNYTYFRAPVGEDNYPCYIYTAIPTTLHGFLGTDVMDSIEMGRFLGFTDYPVYKIPMAFKGKKYDNVRYVFESLRFISDTLLFDIEKDYAQNNPIKDAGAEELMIQKLAKAMKDADSPEEQFERLGIKV